MLQWTDCLKYFLSSFPKIYEVISKYCFKWEHAYLWQCYSAATDINMEAMPQSANSGAQFLKKKVSAEKIF